ncbi:MAG: SAM-dependent chlorinase/fluorinase [bacterium]
MTTIALISDFGYRDAYVGIMKSVIHGIAPHAELIDLCHEVPVHNVMSGSYLVASAVPYLPTKSIVLGVVDPGVGTRRRAIAVRTETHVYVGPDNGLFHMAYEIEEPLEAVELTNSEYHLARISKTFHGRDIFSPVAAHVANGVELSKLGEAIEIESLVRLPEIGPIIKEHGIECSIVHIDHFGNVVTNLSREVTTAAGKVPKYVRIGEHRAPFAETFADVPKNDPVAYFNSTDYLEVGIRNGSAADQLRIKQRNMIHLETE